MKKIILLLIVLSLPNIIIAAADNTPLFIQANSLYEKENYSGAIKTYTEIINNGIINSNVYYNLGNSYYKNNELGRSVLSYKRALRLSPQDSDIKYNLTHVLSFIKEEHEKSPFGKLTDSIFNILALNSLTLFVSIIYILLIITLSISIFVKNKHLPWVNISLGIMLLLSGLWLYSRIYSREIIRKAIVIIQQGHVRNGPGKDYSVAFTVPEGKEVIILKKRNSWYEIGIKEKGIKGWIKGEEIEQI